MLGLPADRTPACNLVLIDGVARAWPPSVTLDDAWLDQIEAVEESGHLAEGAQGHRRDHRLVVAARALGDEFALDVTGRVSERQVAAARNRAHEARNDPVRIFLVPDELQDRNQGDRGRLAEVERPRRLQQD